MYSWKTFKEELKKQAAEIRELKAEIKNKQKARQYAGSEQYTLLKEKDDFRHRHIAYCLLRGTKYEEIERNFRPGNEPDFARIESIKEAFLEKQEASEDVCACA